MIRTRTKIPRGFFLILLISTTFLFNPSTVSGYQEKEAANRQLFVGIAKMNITPDAQVKNWVTGKPYTGVADSLYVHALVLKQGESKAVIITWDLVDAGESATEEVRNAISQELHIPTTQILVNATHNHSAPWAPVYSPGHRGKERDSWWAIRHMPAQNLEPFFKTWMGQLREQTVKAVRQADERKQPASLWISRANASKYMNNRRPRFPESGVEEANVPKGYNYTHKEWNPDLLLGGASFGPLDRTMTLLSFRDEAGGNIASLFHLSVHAVSIYPFSESISADWPGEAKRQISKALGGESMFIQGAAGDVNPWKRGREAVLEMGRGLAEYAKQMYPLSSKLKAGPLKVKRGTVALPLDRVGQERTGRKEVIAEVQILTLGSLALVTLPGEPLTDVGAAIRERSPYPQTIVMGYSNGNGVHYVGMPGEKEKGGYEMEEGTVGKDEAGQLLVELAVQLLEQGEQGNAERK